MAHSKLIAPNMGTLQHFLECDIKYCERNCQFYCNPCHQQMCEQCRDEHLKNPEYKSHEVVPYQQRKWPLPVKKCKIHPAKDIDMLCEECHLPLCSKCATQRNHKGHNFIDLETVYEENMALYHKEVFKILKDFLPVSLKMQKEIEDDAIQIKKTMDSLRTEMKADGESLKSMVDKVVSENIQQVDNIEMSLREEVNSQGTTFQEYISYLNDFVKDFHGRLVSSKLTNLIPELSEKIQEIQPIPERQKCVTSVYKFIAGQYCKNDVVELLGKMDVQDTKTETIPERTKYVTPVFTAGRNCKNDVAELPRRNNVHGTKTEALSERIRYVTPLIATGHCCKNDVGELLGKMNVQETRTVKAKFTRGQQKKEDIENKSDLKQTPTLSSPDTKLFKFKVPVDGSACHISLNKPVSLWVSDYKGNIVQTDLQGNQLQKVKTSGRSGCHTVTRNGNLIFTNEKTRVISVIRDNKITTFIKIGAWEPISIHASRINGDILVGMVRNGEANVTRYSKTGEKLQNIQTDNKGKKLYHCPWYITENGNGDVCTSDIEKQAVVVVNKSGEYSFSYTGQRSGFLPYGICTDALRHILVCDNNSNTVDLLDKDGQFLSLVLTQQQGVYSPRSVCVDEGNNLYVGQFNNTVTVYKYI